MRFPGYGVFTGKVVAFEGSKVDVHWNEDGSSTLLTPAQALTLDWEAELAAELS